MANNNIVIIFIIIIIIIILYSLKKENKLNNINQSNIKFKNASLIPYLEKIKIMEYPKINNVVNNNKLIFNNSGSQNKRNINLNKLNKKYSALEDDIINEELVPKNNELFII